MEIFTKYTDNHFLTLKICKYLLLVILIHVDYGKLSQIILKFKQSEIRISFDGGRNMYEYFRNGKYENIIKNIKKFRKHNKITKLWATNTM